jgi:hypothetical protein
MGIRLTEAGYFDLKAHIGHNIVVVGYKRHGSEDEPINVAIECEDCGEVLVDFERPFFMENDEGELECYECGCDVYEHEEDKQVYCMNETCEFAKPDWGSIGEPS